MARRLRLRRAEIEQATLTRVYSVSDPTEAGDPEYVASLQAAVSAALDYALAGIEDGRAEPGPIPVELLAQARQAARNGVSLDTVLRRYFAGYTLLGDFIMQEGEGGEASGSEEFQHVTRAQATLFDRLVVAVSEEHSRELRERTHGMEQRRAECVERLLAGEFADGSSLAYDLDVWHLGLFVAGEESREALRALAQALDRRLLMVGRGEGTVWAWLGGQRKLLPEEVEDFADSSQPSKVKIAFGEPAHGLAGWRLTHQQAGAAWSIALRCRRSAVRYANVSLLASMLQDEVLVRSLEDLYLLPLAMERDGGKVLRQTLRTYFAAERNLSSAAAALGCNRHTVTSRLQRIESRLARPLHTCAAEVEAALRLDEVTGQDVERDALDRP